MVVVMVSDYGDRFDARKSLSDFERSLEQKRLGK